MGFCDPAPGATKVLLVYFTFKAGARPPAAAALPAPARACPRALGRPAVRFVSPTPRPARSLQGRPHRALVSDTEGAHLPARGAPVEGEAEADFVLQLATQVGAARGVVGAARVAILMCRVTGCALPGAWRRWLALACSAPKAPPRHAPRRSGSGRRARAAWAAAWPPCRPRPASPAQRSAGRTTPPLSSPLVPPAAPWTEGRCARRGRGAGAGEACGAKRRPPALRSHSPHARPLPLGGACRQDAGGALGVLIRSPQATATLRQGLTPAVNV